MNKNIIFGGILVLCAGAELFAMEKASPYKGYKRYAQEYEKRGRRQPQVKTLSDVARNVIASTREELARVDQNLPAYLNLKAQERIAALVEFNNRNNLNRIIVPGLETSQEYARRAQEFFRAHNLAQHAELINRWSEGYLISTENLFEENVTNPQTWNVGLEPEVTIGGQEYYLGRRVANQ